MKNKATIFIGIGNSFHQDDGAGLYILRQVRELLSTVPEYHFAESNGEGTGLMDLWQGYDNVVIFDAVMQQGHPGRTWYFLAEDRTFPSDFFKYSSHAFSVAKAVELARTLENLPQKVTVYGVEGKNFFFGEEISREVRIGCGKIIKQIASSYLDNVGALA